MELRDNKQISSDTLIELGEIELKNSVFQLDEKTFKQELVTDLFVKPTDTHQFLDSSSSRPYHCKKGIPYSRALRLNTICSDNESFYKRCNDLEGWLMERGYNGKMIRKQILRARKHSRKDLLEKQKLLSLN